MAKFSAQSRLKLLLSNNDGMIIRLDSNKIRFSINNGGGGLLRFGDPLSFPSSFHHLLLHKRKPVSSSPACNSSSSKRANSASSFSGHKSKKLNSDDGVDPESVVSEKDGIFDGLIEEELEEFENDDLSFYRGLVLDISYRPVNVVCWKRAICLEFMEKADVLEYYAQTVNSPSGSFYIPAVLRVPHLLQVVKRRRVKRNLSRKNIFWRDNFMCQYCSSGECLTIDHVLPITRGGEWTWENLVTACAKCNSTKGHKTPEEANMKLLKVPKVCLIFVHIWQASLRNCRNDILEMYMGS
ncbi:OLC1v1036210C1 [Oldenlandia corymbosa var. corymbosa]|uniref:OLC1v1036210C1 n=1 Tax=Oldenlandia corymbosa var. corymbosa TaxID=529605 RepID=A0AAV1CW01_OLDCO|nr:OLC1v1036210C1 [Oldenlandia corymbosa var. corymbosa]